CESTLTLCENPLMSTLFLDSSHISQELSFHTCVAMLYSSIRGSCGTCNTHTDTHTQRHTHTHTAIHAQTHAHTQRNTYLHRPPFTLLFYSVTNTHIHMDCDTFWVG